MKNLISMAGAMMVLMLTALPTSAQAWYYHHCYHHVYYHHCCHHYVYHYSYPHEFIEDAHVYVPPYYYYSPYSVVADVLVHRSLEIGPVVPVKPYSFFAAAVIAIP